MIYLMNPMMPPRQGHHEGSAVETPVLWHLEISHYNEKARWALDYKGIAHVRRAVTPTLQELTARRLRAGRTLPVLEMNGRTIGDSTKIIEEIERRGAELPGPPASPAQPGARQRPPRPGGLLRRTLRSRPATGAVQRQHGGA